MFARILVKGVVQGVGFRPFVYHLAIKHSLTGFVANTPAGVHIEVCGPGFQVDGLIEELTDNPPPPSLVKSVHVEKGDVRDGWTDFSIHLSSHEGEEIGPVAPDMDVCEACLVELTDPSNRRFQYPFINCTDCGPRFTIIKAAPYDRVQTSMQKFPLCSICAAEYVDPEDRRFHAQATCCADCGPQISLVDSQGNSISDGISTDPIGQAADLLRQGKILAVKGIGGFHLVVNGVDQEAVQKLRDRKGRPEKPLAVMVKNEEILSLFADTSDDERKWLTCRRKPVVLLTKKNPFPLAANVAPDNNFIGVMFPYTALHHVLVERCDCVALVMTSGNLSGEPIVTDNQAAVEKLAGIADCFLLHDRDIIIGNDDSVIRLAGVVSVLRRSRSFTPEAVSVGRDCGTTLALGAIQKNTICLTRKNDAFMSQHIGDLDNLPTTVRQEQIISHYSSLLRIEPDLLVHDMHPHYAGTSYAEKQHLPTVAVQHHHAHAVSCMAEHKLDGPVLAITLDGSGYGPDHTVWGGEVLVADYDCFKRVAHLDHVSLPGNEAAIQQPWRMAFSYLYETFGHSFADMDMEVVRKFKDNVDIITTMIDRGVNSPVTSSCGRLFDAVAALVGLRYTTSYEGQAAALLEMAVGKENDRAQYPYRLVCCSRPYTIDCRPLIKAVCDDVMAGVHVAVVSRRFHQTVAAMFVEVCIVLRRENGIGQVVLSGGVFQNMLLAGLLREGLIEDGFKVYTHRKIPANDGGIALGQAVAGRAIYEK